MAERDPDARYEFDAPSHVVDFSLETDGREDLWFDQQAARGADGPLQTPMRSSPPPPSSLLLALPQEEVSGPSASTSPPPNLVTSWGDGSPARTGARPKRSAAQPRRVSKRKEETASAPPAKKHKKTPPVPRRSSRVRRSNAPHNARTAPTSKAAASSTAHPDSEQLELEHIGTLQAEVALRRRQNEASYRAALAGQPPPKKAVLPPTLPKEFSLTSNSCVKAPAEPDGVGFVQQLRRPSTPVKALRYPTVPKPFNLSTGHKRAPEAAAYMSTAQQVERFHKRTPDRFHVPSRQAAERGPAALKAEKLKLTEPQSPKLTAGQRSRETERASLQEEEAPPAFRATRLPRKMLEGVVGVPERKLLLPTVPESPAFSLKRLRPQREPEVKPLPPVLRAAPPPHAGVPFQPRLPESRQVEACPFSFEERDRERRSQKERTLQELRHGEVAPFRAQPLPSFHSVLLPEKKTLAPTRPEPFRLLVDQRGALRSALREQQVRDEQRREEGAAFRARPNTVTHKEPFQPRKEARPPVVVEAFQLSTERRAAERQEFEQQAGAREALGRLLEERQQQEQQQEEKEEVARLRREQVHAAQPVRHYRALAVKKSELPLTVPLSPNFSDRFRL